MALLILSLQDGFLPEVLVEQDGDGLLNCSTIEQVWELDPEAFNGTEFVEIKEKCENGELTTPEDVTAEVEDVEAPNGSIDDQISATAHELCTKVSSGDVQVDVDVSEIEAACSNVEADPEAVVDAAAKIQAQLAPKDEDAEKELEETCVSIMENRDKIEAALLELAARSERKLQESGSIENAPVTSFQMATDMLDMYDCLCDQSNPDNVGCTKKALKLTEIVSQSVEEQAETDMDADGLLSDIEESLKVHTSHLRHSAYDSNEVEASLERALSEVGSSVGKCDPPGISDTPHNSGKKLCL